MEAASYRTNQPSSADSARSPSSGVLIRYAFLMRFSSKQRNTRKIYGRKRRAEKGLRIKDFSKPERYGAPSSTSLLWVVGEGGETTSSRGQRDHAYMFDHLQHHLFCSFCCTRDARIASLTLSHSSSHHRRLQQDAHPFWFVTRVRNTQHAGLSHPTLIQSQRIC